MNYKEAYDYVYSFIDYERVRDSRYDRRSYNIERTSALLELLGNPHRDFDAVHIAGTKGKGSTAAMVASILRSAGLSVGLFTSPHLLDFRERINVGGKMISREDICREVERIEPCVRKITRKPEFKDLTFWEVLTSLSFDYFSQKKVNFAVVEVGMGGRLDATNVLSPALSAITPIGLDHMDKLGDTVERIASEKAGIIKENGVVISGVQPPKAAEVICSFCERKGARLVELGVDVIFKRESFCMSSQVFSLRTPTRRYEDLRIPLIGRHQVENAAMAAAIVDLLSLSEDIPPEQRGALSEGAIRDGLSSVVLPGRLQIVSPKPTLVLDGAHNPDKAKALREAVEEFFRYNRLILVFGANLDKDIPAFWREIGDMCDIVVLTKVDFPKAVEPEFIAEGIEKPKSKVIITQNVAEAIDKARSEAAPDDLILVTGSFYVVGDAMKHLGIEAS